MTCLSQKRLVILLLGSILLHSFGLSGQVSNYAELYVPNRSIGLSEYSAHNPILIHGNTGFVSGGYPGAGTENNPYVIENFEIDVGDNEVAIEIRETDAHFIIRNCKVSMNEGIAVQFSNVVNGRIESCEFIGRNIIFDNSNHCDIVDCTMSQVAYEGAIELHLVRNCYFSGNMIEQCNIGIFLLGSNDSVIHNNMLNDNFVGIDLYLCSNISLLENSLVNNGVRLTLWWVAWEGHSLQGSDFDNINHNFENNEVNGKPLGFFFNESSRLIDGGQYGQVILLNCRDVILKNGCFVNATNGVQILHCNDCVIKNVTIEKNSMWGVDILFSTGTKMTNCKIEKNKEAGIFAELSNNTIISHNQISENMENGIVLYILSHSIITNNSIEDNGIGLSFHYSNNCTIIDNTIQYNTKHGVYFYDESNNNTFYGNSFGWNEISHIEHGWLSESANNYWDDGISQGNYWSDYFGFGVYQPNRYDIDHYPSCIGICPFTIILAVALVTTVMTVFFVIRQKRLK